MYAKRALNTDWAKLDSVSINTHPDDPYANKMERLRYAVVLSPGSLAPNIRQAISEATYLAGPLGTFAQKVAEHAFMVDDDDIRELHRAHYSDDQIFEAAVSAALGAGLYRLERVRAVLRANQPAATTHDELPGQRNTFRKPRQLKVTA